MSEFETGHIPETEAVSPVTTLAKEAPDTYQEYHVPTNLHTPQFEVTTREAGEALPNQEQELRSILEEIDHQIFENYQITESIAYPGVKFSHTKLLITPEIMQRIFSHQVKAQPEPISNQEATSIEFRLDNSDTSDGKQPSEEADKTIVTQTHFLFGALAPPPAGDALGMNDMAVDRFIREMPSVVAAMKRGQQPPQIEIYMMGTPTGFGGEVNQAWIQQTKDDYLGSYGKLYAEFISQYTQVNPDQNQRIVVQGASKGALIAAQAANTLPSELREVAQLRMDNPAGGHGESSLRALKSLRVAKGLALEGLHALLFDQTLKQFSQLTGPYYKEFSAQSGLPSDSAEQLKLKKTAAAVETWNLFKGASPEVTAMRSWIVRGIEDSLTRSLVNRIKIKHQATQSDSTGVYSQQGRQTEAAIGGSHFFAPYQHYQRWGHILEYCQKAVESSTTNQPPMTELSSEAATLEQDLLFETV